LISARRNGMAEIATSVLHNVGNVLNSVNVSACLLREKLHSSKTSGLTKAVQLIGEHAADLGEFLSHDERGKRLPGYLQKLAEALGDEQRSMVDEIGLLTKNIDHIKDIVATQQSYAGASAGSETAQICDLIEDAVRINAGALVRQDVTVVKELAVVPSMPLDKHRILQILVNLISNAKYAMDGVPGRPHEVTIRVDAADPRALRIHVIDNGEGIPAENLSRIFSHGFTTRKDGHGFGLHSCMAAAKAMGGALLVHSEGRGSGATFTLELPVRTLDDDVS
jgi:signal transduction histidine kinase